MKCLYCEKSAGKNPHFQSGCCKRGMCGDCYGSDVGTMEQLQIDYVDDETYKEFSKQIDEANKNGFDYLCFEHMVKN